jgi:hypothetical protein
MAIQRGPRQVEPCETGWVSTWDQARLERGLGLCLWAALLAVLLIVGR